MRSSLTQKVNTYIALVFAVSLALFLTITIIQAADAHFPLIDKLRTPIDIENPEY